MPERRTHDYLRHGITSPFAAFNITDGSVLSALHPRRRAIEFKKLLTRIDSTVAARRVNIAVFGATGRVFLEAAADAGHSTTAFVRDLARPRGTRVGEVIVVWLVVFFVRPAVSGGKRSRWYR
ncbi:hypothetical protein [Streptomyces sp. NPDC094469]|uniref:hypothetical protein n=1 Tax=Streptomyces sp. NPDC094469 TaxID=3366067 RepID=UPI003809C6E0